MAKNIRHLPGHVRGGEVPGPRSGAASPPERPRRPVAANDNRMPASKVLGRALRLGIFLAVIVALGWGLFR